MKWYLINQEFKTVYGFLQVESHGIYLLSRAYLDLECLVYWRSNTRRSDQIRNIFEIVFKDIV